MLCEAFLPYLPLRDYIECYQLRRFIFSNQTNSNYKPYAPRPEHTLAFYPRGFERVEYVSDKKFIQRPRSMIMGQYTERTNRHVSNGEFFVILVVFKPGILYRITGIPFYELNNTFIDAEAVFSKEIRLVNERLSSIDDYKEMIIIIEQFLYRLKSNIQKDKHAVDGVASLIIHHPENNSVLKSARESFLCTRQFERIFKERMGISPKIFIRIARMNKAFRLKCNNPDCDWLSIALDCGYHDYQHLAKDFKDFAGTNPNNYFLEDENAPERFFGLKDSSM
ncbi:MAG TPA: helix-turn-helix domain-containing protein [Parafilimonas sp.]|nr:helix-turn-helix domain-containing protein [Parafilimonas sp.]